MKRLIFADKNSAKQVRRIIDRALGFPVPPVQVGVGPWMADPPGAERYTEVRRVRGQQKWVVVCDRKVSDIPLTPKQWSRLTAIQQASLTSALASQEDDPEILDESTPDD